MKPVSAMAEKRHELLREIADHTAEVLRDHNIADDVADQAAAAVADHLSLQWGGSTVSFPKDHRYRLSKRDLKILGEFNGRNHYALAQRYDLSENAIYKLLKRVQDRKFARDQGRLNLGDGCD